MTHLNFQWVVWPFKAVPNSGFWVWYFPKNPRDSNKQTFCQDPFWDPTPSLITKAYQNWSLALKMKSCVNYFLAPHVKVCKVLNLLKFFISGNSLQTDKRFSPLSKLSFLCEILPYCVLTISVIQYSRGNKYWGRGAPHIRPLLPPCRPEFRETTDFFQWPRWCRPLAKSHI